MPGIRISSASRRVRGSWRFPGRFRLQHLMPAHTVMGVALDLGRGPVPIPVPAMAG